MNVNDSPLFVDYRKGSVNLALYEPVRSLLCSCLDCDGRINTKSWIFDQFTSTYHRSDKKTICSCMDTGRTLSTLSSGDVSFTGQGANGPLAIGIEVKEVTELLSALVTGRLQDTQMGGMLQDYDDGGRWILYYGRYRKSPIDGSFQIYREGSPQRRAGWYTVNLNGRQQDPHSTLESFLCCSAREAGFDVVRVENIIEAAQWLGTLYHTWSRPYHSHKSMKVFDKSSDIRSRMRRENVKSGKVYKVGHKGETVNYQMDTEQKRLMDRAAVFHQFPNLGYERAVTAARHFKSVRQGVNASAEEWANLEIIVKGKVERVVKLGRSVAENIVKFLS